MQLYEQIEKEFDEKFKCIQSDCDGGGYIPHQIGEDEWEAQQCQFHAEYLFPIKSFLKQSFIKFLENECERLADKIKFYEEMMRKAKNTNKLAAWRDFSSKRQALSDTISHYQNMIKELQNK